MDRARCGGANPDVDQHYPAARAVQNAELSGSMCFIVHRAQVSGNGPSNLAGVDAGELHLLHLRGSTYVQDCRCCPVDIDQCRIMFLAQDAIVAALTRRRLYDPTLGN